MKKYLLLFLLMIIAVSAEIYGQSTKAKRVISTEILHSRYHTRVKFPNGKYDDPYIPSRDTVIMLGEEIEVGAYFERKDKDRFEEVIDILGFARSKKSDHDKGYFTIKVKPKKTTRYTIRIRNTDPTAPDFIKHLGHGDRRVIYVAKTKEEKQQIEDDLNKQRQVLIERKKAGLPITITPETVR